MTSGGERAAPATGQAPRRALAVALLGAAAATAAVLVAAYSWAPAAAAGADDALAYRRFSATELLDDGVAYRWSRGGLPAGPEASAVVLPQVGTPRGGLLELDVRSGEAPVTLSLVAGNRKLLETTVRDPVRLSVAIPRDACAGGDVSVQLLSPPEGRVAVSGIRWTPRGWTSPPGRQLLVLPGLAALLALLLRLLKASVRASGLWGGFIGGGVALASGRLPLEVAPFTPQLLLILVLALGALVLWGGLVRGPRVWGGVPETVGPGSLLVLLGVAYWAILLYQRLLCRTAGPALCPRGGAELIGALSAVALVAISWAPAAWRSGAALGALGAGAVAEALYAAALAFRRPAVDFMILWNGARDFSRGRPLYKMDEVLSERFGLTFRVPPFYAMLYLPFTDTEASRVLLFHRILNLALYAATAVLLFALLRGRRLGAPPALAGVVLVMGLMQPAFDTVTYGQIDIVLLLLLTLAFAALVGGRPALVGFLIALAAMFKIYPVLILAFLVARKEWRALAWTGAFLALLNGVSMAVMGWRVHVHYATRVMPHLGGGASWIENQTLNGFLARLFTGTVATVWIHDPVLDALTDLGFALVVGASTLLAARASERGSALYALQFSCLVVAMIAVLPAAWFHYSTITIPAFLALLLASAESPLPPAAAAIAALAFGLVSYGNQWSFFAGEHAKGLPTWALSYRFCGLALLWGLLAASVVRAGRWGEGSPP